jgi:hypothetical protein
MNGLVIKLNKVIKDAADNLNRAFDGGIYFVDEFEEKFDGHRFCEVEQDASYHNKPIADRTWFIHYESPYENPSSVTGLGPGTFFDQVDAILIPPKDGKSTADQIKAVNGDLAKLNPAYKDVDSMTAALTKLGQDDQTKAMLPITWIRVMHPKGSGYTVMSDAVIDKVVQFSATGKGSTPASSPSSSSACSKPTKAARSSQ